jgi:hypothetical protein
MNYSYFSLLKFLLLTALITFCSHKTCNKSFAIPIAYKGYDGCPSHHKFPQAKLIFPLDLSKKHQPHSSSRSPGIPTLFSYSLFNFSHRCFFFIFSSPRNFEKGFAVTLQTVAYALYRFLGH